jgi:hypothetical protein
VVPAPGVVFTFPGRKAGSRELHKVVAVRGDTVDVVRWIHTRAKFSSVSCSVGLAYFVNNAVPHDRSTP